MHEHLLRAGRDHQAERRMFSPQTRQLFLLSAFKMMKRQAGIFKANYTPNVKGIKQPVLTKTWRTPGQATQGYFETHKASFTYIFMSKRTDPSVIV